MRMSSGKGAKLVVFGGGGKRLLRGAGAGAGAAGPGAAGVALGTEVAPQPPPQLLHCGQTHSTVQPRTQCSFVTGQTISLWTVRTRQRQSQPSWQPGSQPVLQGPQAAHPVAPPPAQAPPHSLAFSQPPHRSPMRVTPGMQMSLHLQQYL